jgi:carbonic anhydrase
VIKEQTMFIIKSSLILLLIGIVTAQVSLLERMRRDESHANKHWGYRNEDRSLLPSDWHKKHAKCYGTKQSPINVESRATTYDAGLAQVNINRALTSGDNEIGEDKEKWQIKNNGHSSQ